jgi:hypothetical protein
MTKILLSEVEGTEMFDGTLGTLIELAKNRHNLKVELIQTNKKVWIQTDADIECCEFLKIVLDILTAAMIAKRK